MLTAADVGAFHALGISQAILAAARVERVDDVDAHRLLSTRRYGDLSGIVFPYVHPLTHQVVARRLRRDHPEVEGGKQKDKYIATYGDRRRLYFPPDCNGWLTDASVRLFVVEAEKSVLSLASAGAFAIGTGGCWGWRGRIGKVEDAAGNRVDELGPLPDLNYVTWADRDVCIAFDSNAAANANVRAARRGLARELTGRGAVVHVVDVPAEPGINGPDDYVGAHGAAAFFALADAAATTDGKAWPQTEIGDAECFADAYGEDVRYDHAQGRWLLTSETGIWIPDPMELLRGFTVTVMRQRQKSAWNEPDAEAKKRAFKWAVDGESSRRISNALREARAIPPIADDGLNWDVDPWLLGAQDGVVDLRIGRGRKATPEDRVTMRARVPYDPSAACPLWIATLASVFNYDDDLIDYVWRAFGYSLSGDCREECFFVNWGEGGNGKGTVMNTMAWVLADYADNLPFASLEATDRTSIPTDVAKLVGRRFVTASESSGDAVHLNEARIKALTGQDPITARFLHKNYFTFQPVAKFWLASNLKPTVKDESEGFWRRVHLIPFTQSFIGREDKTLKQRLRDEAPGILAWAVRGCLEWQAHGLNPPPAVLAATKTYREESDPLAAFFADRCVFVGNVQASVLYGAYKQWAEQCGFKHKEYLTLTAFGRLIKKRFNVAEGRHTTYLGVALRADDY